MAKSLRAAIKAFFQTGDVPTQAEYVDTIDSSVYWLDDVVTTIDNTSTDDQVPTAKATYDLLATATGFTNITRSALSTLESTNSLTIGIWYKITDAIGSTRVILVTAETVSQLSKAAINLTSYEFGQYTIAGDTFVAIGGTAWGSITGTLSAQTDLQTALDAKKDTFTLFSQIGSWAAPADSTTYYFGLTGGIVTPLSVITTYLTTLPFSFKICGIVVQHLNNTGTQGTSENVTVGIRNNTDATNTNLITIQTNQASGVVKMFEDQTLNITIPASKACALYMTTPAWATNPTNLIFRVTLFIQKT